MRRIGRCAWTGRAPLAARRATSTTSSSSTPTSASASASTSTSTPTPAATPSPESVEAVLRIVQAFEGDTQLLEAVVAKMEADNRRRLVIAGGAMEWFGKENIALEVESADADKDRVISPKDFDKWFECALRRRAEARAPPCAAAEGAASAGSGSGRAEDIPFAALCMIAVEAGLPFVGFGFLDNATMILAGDAIDHSVGFYLNCSVMASAAMGNVVSGACGMQVHGLVEKAVQRLNFQTPVLSDEQRKGRRVFLAGHIGGTVGIMFGLCLGMLPLLMIHGDDDGGKADAVVFHRWDADGDGFIEEAEMLTGLHEAGFSSVDAAAVSRIMDKYSSDGARRLTLDRFKVLCRDLRHHHQHKLD